uniref:Uncharacterized protein n=1 Tax=Caenorhabditis japonica TaxID=281687 RepID=A0A8R1ES36_CAEJA
MREPRRPRSTAAEKYTDAVNGHNGFGGYESGEFYSETSDEGRRNRRNVAEEESEEEDEEEEEEEIRNYYMEARRAQGSRSVTTNLANEGFDGEDEKYYYGVVKLGSQIVDHVLRTMPPPEDYYKLKPIERVAYLFYCAVYKKPYQNISEFHKIFNREFFKYVCAGDTNDLALFKV